MRAKYVGQHSVFRVTGLADTISGHVVGMQPS